MLERLDWGRVFACIMAVDYFADICITLQTSLNFLYSLALLLQSFESADMTVQFK